MISDLMEEINDLRRENAELRNKLENEKHTFTDEDGEFLMEDVGDYLMENHFDIGTNFKEEFPNTVVHNGIIELKDKNYKTQFILRIERTANDWERYIGYLISWAKDHKYAVYEGMSPACFDEFLENDDE